MSEALSPNGVEQASAPTRKCPSLGERRQQILQTLVCMEPVRQVTDREPTDQMQASLVWLL